MQKCSGLFGWMFGHKFRARFNEESEGKWPFKEGTLESQITVASCPSVNSASIINSTKSKSSKYVLEVCERCGEIIKHDEP